MGDCAHCSGMEMIITHYYRDTITTGQKVFPSTRSSFKITKRMPCNQTSKAKLVVSDAV